MILIEPETITVASLKPTLYNKTIEVIVYRKCTLKHVRARQSTKYCCMLIDKEAQEISNIGCLEHYFNFAACNKVKGRAESKTRVITDDRSSTTYRNHLSYRRAPLCVSSVVTTVIEIEYAFKGVQSASSLIKRMQDKLLDPTCVPGYYVYWIVGHRHYRYNDVYLA
uniref:Uncharacterized protein n=1 Tax=Tanacetum cinerariifolium TaxID=118510 RepID=A0A6L2LQX1_TANCI|nr:hypothetical protein [Tanacetum cinerariifolium]